MLLNRTNVTFPSLMDVEKEVCTHEPRLRQGEKPEKRWCLSPSTRPLGHVQAAGLWLDWTGSGSTTLPLVKSTLVTRARCETCPSDKLDWQLFSLLSAWSFADIRFVQFRVPFPCQVLFVIVVLITCESNTSNFKVEWHLEMLSGQILQSHICFPPKRS